MHAKQDMVHHLAGVDREQAHVSHSAVALVMLLRFFSVSSICLIASDGIFSDLVLSFNAPLLHGLPAEHGGAEACLGRCSSHSHDCGCSMPPVVTTLQFAGEVSSSCADHALAQVQLPKHLTAELAMLNCCSPCHSLWGAADGSAARTKRQ